MLIKTVKIPKQHFKNNIHHLEINVKWNILTHTLFRRCTRHLLTENNVDRPTRLAVTAEETDKQQGQNRTSGEQNRWKDKIREDCENWDDSEQLVCCGTVLLRELTFIERGRKRTVVLRSENKGSEMFFQLLSKREQ